MVEKEFGYCEDRMKIIEDILFKVQCDLIIDEDESYEKKITSRHWWISKHIGENLETKI